MSTAKFESDCIAAHNQYRRDHRVGVLSQKSELSRRAQKWANYLASVCTLVHSQNRKYGENIAMTTKENPSGKEITAMWYDEIEQYDFRRPGFLSETGHFTQVVWKGTTHIGIGIARGPSGTYVVANYEPAGNITNSGYFANNVFRPGNTVLQRFDEPKRRYPLSSSSSSSSDDERFQRKVANPSDCGSTTETNVQTNVEELTDDMGRRVRKTTKTTTTITTKGSMKSKTTKMEVNTKYISGGSDNRSNRDDLGIQSDMDQLHVRDSGMSSSMTTEDLRRFEEECVNRHNELRRKHGAPPLRRSEKLQKQAQKWAEYMVSTRIMQHSGESDLGENVAYKYSSDKRRLGGEEIANMWYDEIKNYNFNNPGFFSATGHFTQLVWAASQKIGVGVASDGNGTIFAVANYYPAGNFVGKFSQNIRPPMDCIANAGDSAS